MPPATWNGQDAQRIARSLRGDLDNIVRKALRYEPQERYSSVGKLADDLKRYQQGEPVTATRDTPMYSLRKFVGKYRWVVSATLLLVLTLAAFALSAQRQAREIARERDKAEESARDARLTRDFLVGLLQVADAASLKDNKVPLDSLLDQGFARLESGEVANAAVRVELLQVLAESYQVAARFPPGRPAPCTRRPSWPTSRSGRAKIFPAAHGGGGGASPSPPTWPAAGPELEQARPHASAEGKRRSTSSCSTSDLHSERFDSYRAARQRPARRAAGAAPGRSPAAGSPSWRATPRSARCTAITRKRWRSASGFCDQAGSARPGLALQGAVITAESALRLAGLNLGRLDGLEKANRGMAARQVAADERQHTGTLMIRSQNLQYLVDTGNLDRAEPEAAAIEQELAKLLAVDANDPRALLRGRQGGAAALRDGPPAHRQGARRPESPKPCGSSLRCTSASATCGSTSTTSAACCWRAAGRRPGR